MKKITRLIILTIIALVTFNCENEQLLENGAEEQSVDFKVYAFEPEQIPNITSSIEKASKRTWKSLGSKNKQQPFWVDTKNIVGVQDSLGNTTYSFRTHFEGANPNSIFNIVATKRANSKEIKPFMMEYEFDDIFSEPRKKIAIRYYSLNGFIGALSNFSGKGDEWNNVPLDPCGEMEISSSSGGSANTGSGGTGTSTNPNSPRNSGNRNTYNNYGSYTVISYGNPSSTRGGGSVQVGRGCFCSPSTPSHALKNGFRNGKSDDGDCPKDEMDIAVNEVKTPPSCKSFDYKKTASNWQEASVMNIRFNVVVIEIVAGIRVKKIIPIIFPQSVKFGVPQKFKNGSNISSGLAAELSAQAIEDSIDDVISKYNNLVVNSTDVIRNQFKERLKHNHKERTNGGRVNFNSLISGVQPTQYKTSAILDDDCN